MSVKVITMNMFSPYFQLAPTLFPDTQVVLNRYALELPKLEATSNLIKVIKHNAFGFRNFENLKKRILIALNIRKERTKHVLSKC